MKKIYFSILMLCAQFAYAQNNISLLKEDQKVLEILSLNLNSDHLPDSVAVYSYYIQITPHKNEIKDIYVSSPEVRKIFGNIDSLFKGTDFNKFLKGTNQKFIVIPIGILVASHEKMKTNSKIDFSELAKAIPKLMAANNPNRYNAVFLSPFFAIVDKKIYN